MYRFTSLRTEDLALLNGWLALPHLRPWWEASTYTPADLSEPRVRRWIVSHADKPFAFMQDYSVHGWENHHFAHLIAGARGIDQFIGDPLMLGRGHGTAFLRQRMAELFAEGVPVIATDPHPENNRAIAVYKKLGFNVLGPAEKTPWGLILPMVAEP